MIRSISRSDVPWLTAAQMREVDHLMVEHYHVTLLQMMENAGRSLAALARDPFLGGDPRGKRVVVLAGGGGNGGGGLACARRLAAWGADVHVFVSLQRGRLLQATEAQAAALGATGVPVHFDSTGHELGDAALVIDAVLGYGATGAPYGNAEYLIEAANNHAAPVLSLDLPSGLDATTGEAPGAIVRADATLTLALPKTGLRAPTAQPYVGELYLADIGVPPQLYAEPPFRMDVAPLFATSDVVRVG